MKGDFTRNTFDKTKHFSRVLMQQGRVQLDADWNEQADIQQHRVQGLARDLIGPHGWPGAQDDENLGFGIVDVNSLPADEQQRLKNVNILPLDQGDFLIAKGRYYVDGIQCENEEYCTYLHQPDWPGQPELEKGNSFLVYLDVWERHITSMEDMALRESGLGALGPDTATRAKTVWQVKVTDQLADESDITADTKCKDVKDADWKAWLAKWQPENRGQLKAKAMDAADGDSEDACITPPDARYRGFENQLYRVEIHRSGEAGTATCKWSRDNVSGVFPVREFSGGTITLGDLGRDDFHTLEHGQWVELVDDDIALREEVNPLGKVKDVRPDDMVVIVEWTGNYDPPSYDEADCRSKHVLLRRWDHHQLPSSAPGAPDFHAATGTLLVEESAPEKPEIWLTLEQGIQILFAKPKTGEPHQYRSGDYWLIPARTSTGDVEWPGEVGKPDPLPPHGVEHHYAPLALISVGGDGIVTTNGNDCRQKFMAGLGPDVDLQVHHLRVAGNIFMPNTNLGQAGNLYFGGITDVGEIGLRLFGGNVNGTLPSGFIDVRAGTSTDGLIVRVDTGNGNQERMRVTADGNIGIGTPEPKYLLEVAGEAAKSGGGEWTVSSDLTLKKNVKSLQDALGMLLQLRGVSFEWKEPEKQGNLTGPQMGMVAQEVEKVIPAWVGTNLDGTKNLTIRGFSALVVEAVRELNSKVDHLLERLDVVEHQLGITVPPIPAVKEEASATEKEINVGSEITRKSAGKKSKK